VSVEYIHYLFSLRHSRVLNRPGNMHSSDTTSSNRNNKPQMRRPCLRCSSAISTFTSPSTRWRLPLLLVCAPYLPNLTWLENIILEFQMLDHACSDLYNYIESVYGGDRRFHHWRMIGLRYQKMLGHSRRLVSSQSGNSAGSLVGCSWRTRVNPFFFWNLLRPAWTWHPVTYSPIERLLSRALFR
jgi:hypothetical protein